MLLLDRLLTIVVTATLTSAVWIVAGGTIMQRAGTVGHFATAAAPASKPAKELGSPESAAPKPILDTAGHTVPTVAETGRLTIPVAGKRPQDLTDTFTDKRGGGSRLHEALDIMAPEGTPVLSAASGKVEKLFYSNAGGKTAYVRSGDGQTIYYYAHLKDYATGLAEGQSVTAGQRLGEVGITGNASAAGPHLHFAIMRTTRDAKWWEPSTAINPYPLLAGN